MIQLLLILKISLILVMDLHLHPAFVHFPIALIITAFIFQAIHLWKYHLICRTTSMWLLGFAAISSLGANVTGQRDAIKVGQIGYETIILETIQWHKLMAKSHNMGKRCCCPVGLFFPEGYG